MSPHPLTTTPTLGYTPIPPPVGVVYNIPEGRTRLRFICMDEYLHEFCLTYRIDIDADLGKVHAAAVADLQAGMPLDGFVDALEDILIEAYCDHVFKGDYRATMRISKYIASLGASVDQMYPSHPLWRKHLKIIVDDYVSDMTKLLAVISNE